MANVSVEMDRVGDIAQPSGRPSEGLPAGWTMKARKRWSSCEHRTTEEQKPSPGRAESTKLDSVFRGLMNGVTSACRQLAVIDVFASVDCQRTCHGLIADIACPRTNRGPGL